MTAIKLALHYTTVNQKDFSSTFGFKYAVDFWDVMPFIVNRSALPTNKALPLAVIFAVSENGTPFIEKFPTASELGWKVGIIVG